METLLITFIIIITIAAILLLKLTEKIYHQKGQADLLNEIYLTGKAKEDFGMYLVNTNKNADWETFYKLPEIYQNALTIEWFDSVGIQIEINICSWSKGYEFSPTVYTNFIYIGNMSATCCIDRKTATKQAIKKANEIYNKE